ncbi:prolipoprotein diacylglyceryl transferase [Lactococcus nasutitermitis]|uniref:Phosphatidylglycerol--prolipoprotein diacylglyceryl transferase n=1 Tax=Lactococcus nasutitermitis TaxID=1652957 RepID=A0ABV9JAA7_9LACT|nr:prolipoprotein diacylglyceryl transferase [Lactococcus nasutitermitis]
MTIQLPFLALSKIALKLGPLEIHWYAILIVTGAALAVWLACKEAPRRKMTVDDVIDFILIAFPVGIVGARTYYVAFEWSYYSQHPSQIIAMWDGGGAIYGSLIAGAIVLFIFCHYRMINPLDLLDITIPGVALAQAFGRWGNFVNQEAYGKAVSNLDWLPHFIQQQMFIDGAYRLPTFLFESTGDFLCFLLIILLRHRLTFLKRGEIFAFYLIWYGTLRFFVEGMRTDSLMLGPARVSQWFSALLVLTGILFIIIRRVKKYN